MTSLHLDGEPTPRCYSSEVTIFQCPKQQIAVSSLSFKVTSPASQNRFQIRCIFSQSYGKMYAFMAIAHHISSWQGYSSTYNVGCRPNTLGQFNIKYVHSRISDLDHLHLFQPMVLKHFLYLKVLNATAATSFSKHSRPVFPNFYPLPYHFT